MPSKGPNGAAFADRLRFVDNVFNDILKLVVSMNSFKESPVNSTQPCNIEAIAYDPEMPFPYNNFVFAVETKTDITAENRHGKKPGTVQIPQSHKKFVLRLPNRESSYNNDVRVENEVAALMLARQALHDHTPDIVPRVFAWESAAGGQQGWMLQEFMPGKSLSDEFPKMVIEDQQKFLQQMADILKCFQQFEIPSSVRGYGGLTFDGAGQVVIGPVSFMHCGPFDTYDDLVLGTIHSKLVEADKNKMIVGWTENNKNIRIRLDKFLTIGLKTMMTNFNQRNQRLVHGDFYNVLYDPSTMEITAVLDFDFSHIGTVADDFFRSLGHGIGRFPDPREGEEILPLNRAMLEEFPSPVPEPDDAIQWPIAKSWADALTERNMFRPGNIRGIETLSSLFWLSSQLLPFKLAWDFIIENSGKERALGWKLSGEKLLDEFLTDQGF